MSLLLYCLVQNSGKLEIDRVTGIGGQPLVLLSRDDLAGVVSVLSAQQLGFADLRTIMTYRRVIDYFHRNTTIVPMRFGCVFPEETQLLQFLEDHSLEYRALVNDLDGCAEMGIRVLHGDPAWEKQPAAMKNRNPVLPAPDLGETGKAYLAARRIYYANKNQLVDVEQALIENIQKPFAGLFVRCKAEKSTPMMKNNESSERMLSLYFLVKREKIEAFRRVFQEFTCRCRTKTLLSGPWAPFNFVVPEVG